MKRCHICERKLDHDHDPYYVDTDAGHYEDERFEVAMRNHWFVTACWSCWFKWPDAHKRCSPVGDGISPAEPIAHDRLLELVGSA